jgi:hypothetical protein
MWWVPHAHPRANPPHRLIALSIGEIRRLPNLNRHDDHAVNRNCAGLNTIALIKAVLVGITSDDACASGSYRSSDLTMTATSRVMHAAVRGSRHA